VAGAHHADVGTRFTNIVHAVSPSLFFPLFCPLQEGKGAAANVKAAAAATAHTARAAMGNAQVVADAVEGVQESLANVAKVRQLGHCFGISVVV
jgi:hypothetical protein